MLGAAGDFGLGSSFAAVSAAGGGGFCSVGGCLYVLKHSRVHFVAEWILGVPSIHDVR
ncbi:transmembrane protein, putative [Medicago truncatula]|uniref:Transmembrane protein, putative n=1 Tax=Medicago truncatula TaxID=3880 RepID=G7ITJ3_MEDTR|nr:transmembrane protein, putative [Medicago truncatula]